MKIYRQLTDLPETNIKYVVALGNFDGVHLGHQFLIRQAVALAKEIQGEAAVLTFDPHPLKILKPESYPSLILAQDDKIRALEGLGVEALVLLPFSEELAKLSPEVFVGEVLVGKLRVAGVVVGYNYSFGFGGKGTPEQLKNLAKEHNFSLQVIPPVSINGEVVSSSGIRTLINEGDVKKAQDFLGYPPFIKGKVVPGDQRGRELGFPTANLLLNPEIISPAKGVYAVKILGLVQTYGGVANIGTRPTFLKDNQEKNLEVHIFDLQDDNIYGKEIRVEFLTRLRGEIAFSSAEELVKQIHVDINEAKTYYNSASR